MTFQFCQFHFISMRCDLQGVFVPSAQKGNYHITLSSCILLISLLHCTITFQSGHMSQYKDAHSSIMQNIMTLHTLILQGANICFHTLVEEIGKLKAQVRTHGTFVSLTLDIEVYKTRCRNQRANTRYSNRSNTNVPENIRTCNQ